MNRAERTGFSVMSYVPATMSRFLTWSKLTVTKSEEKCSPISSGRRFADRLNRFPDSVFIPKVGEVPTDVLLFCGSVIVGSLYVYCRARDRRWKDDDGRASASATEEATKHSWKQRNGFKDKSLYDFIDTCVERRKTLRKVEDPRVARMAKIEALKLADKAKPKGMLGLSPDRLQTERRRLQNVTNKPADFGGENG
jgi:hypothetical protein